MTDKKLYIESAINTINVEIDGLNSLLDFFDDNYVKAIDLILNSNGRVILSGMGKSGHVANKIAATLSSTGTPAFFIHPAEASHGDLGMITIDDVVILLSNSGETKELQDITYYCKRFSISLICIVRRAESELARLGDVALILPEIPEANHLKAPTTSTTMMIALGDAIAASLITAKGFSETDFGVLHPGGKLGSAFLKVKDLMRIGDAIPSVNDNKSMSEVLIEMTSKCLGCSAIIDDNHNLIGIVTDGDLRRHITNNFFEQKISEVMTKNPLTINSEMLAVEAIALMNKKSITNLFVVESDAGGSKIIGVLHIHDCLKAGLV
jgi:arabinose-5-phosphate isomerase